MGVRKINDLNTMADVFIVFEILEELDEFANILEKEQYYMENELSKTEQPCTIHSVSDSVFTIEDMEKAFNAGKRRYSCGHYGTQYIEEYPRFSDFIDKHYRYR